MGESPRSLTRGIHKYQWTSTVPCRCDLNWPGFPIFSADSVNPPNSVFLNEVLESSEALLAFRVLY